MIRYVTIMTLLSILSFATSSFIIAFVLSLSDTARKRFYHNEYKLIFQSGFIGLALYILVYWLPFFGFYDLDTQVLAGIENYNQFWRFLND